MLKLYDSLASWWPLMSAPADYEEEASIYANHLAQIGAIPARTVLELGCGGGNNASFLKHRFSLTLVDPSPGMLAHSRALNPDCDHHVGDMRDFRLPPGAQFDRVFIHDAICYMTTLDDVRRAIATAFYHCRPGGAVLIAPDCVTETFRPSTDEGGNDSPEGSLRYLEWCWDPDPSDCTYVVDYAFLLRDATGAVRVEHDRHIEGVFPRAEWLRVLKEQGFVAHNLTFQHSEVDYPLDLFAGVKP